MTQLLKITQVTQDFEPLLYHNAQICVASTLYYYYYSRVTKLASVADDYEDAVAVSQVISMCRFSLCDTV